MIRMLITVISLYLISSEVFSQTCIHKDLSRKVIIMVQTKRIKITDQDRDSCIVKVKIVDKRTKKEIQEISLATSLLFESDFSNCRSVRSYITGKRVKSEVMDNDFGDIVMADFNFDSKEDIAIKCDVART